MYEGLTVCDPESDFVPAHPFDAKQDVALEEFQESVNAEPWLIEEGFAVKEAVGLTWFTLTVTESDACCPFCPEHVMLYVVVIDGLTVWDPDNALVPDQPFDAKHEVAFEEFQESVDADPWVIDEGLAFKETVGVSTIWFTVTVAESDTCCPLFPEHVSV